MCDFGFLGRVQVVQRSEGLRQCLDHIQSEIAVTRLISLLSCSEVRHPWKGLVSTFFLS